MLHWPVFIAIGICLLISIKSKCQNIENCPIKIDKEYLFAYWYDGWDEAFSPVKWDSHEWFEFFAVSSAGLVVYLNDEPILNSFKENRSEFTVNLSKYVAEPFGNAAYSLGISSLWYICGVIGKNEKARSTGLLAFEALMIDGVITLTAKYILN